MSGILSPIAARHGPDMLASIETMAGSSLQQRSLTSLGTSRPGGPGDFASLLVDGVAKVEAKVAQANEMVTAFALDDSVPVHQVTIALEQARQSVELMVQVRNRLLEGYQQFMNMQA